MIVAATAGGGWLFVTVMGRPPDFAHTEDELVLGVCVIPIVLAAWGVRVGLAKRKKP